MSLPSSKKTRRTWVTIITIIVLMLLFNCAKKHSTKPDKIEDEPNLACPIIGYLPDYRIQSIPKNIGQFATDLIFFSVEPNSAGELNTQRFSNDVMNQMNQIRKSDAVRFHVAVGGWGRSDGFAKMAKDITLRKEFIGQLYRLCIDHQLAGVDYDWEFPENEEENQAYTKLIVDTKAAFEADGLIVSVALNQYQSLNAAAYAALDRVHVMAYDNNGKHSTYEYAVSAINHFLDQNVPKEKLILGLPFYGRDISDFSKTMTYADIVDQYNPIPEIDQVDNIYFNGIKTIQHKTAYAVNEGLGGVMIWEVGQDHEMVLLQAIYETCRTD